MRRVLVVQHGDKERLPGDPGLTAVGVRQAAATARWLSGTGMRPPAIWSSPLRRARETAEPIAVAFGVPVITDARLRERMNWDDPAEQSLAEFLEDWRRASSDRTWVPRRGDSSLRSAERFLGALDVLLADHPSGDLVVVAHGGVTTDVLRTVLGDVALGARAPTLIEGGVPSCAITTLDATDGGWVVASIAATDHLDG